MCVIQTMSAGRLVHPTAPVLFTKSDPLGTRIGCPAVMEHVGLVHFYFASNLYLRLMIDLHVRIAADPRQNFL